MTKRITLFVHEENAGTSKPVLSGYLQFEDGSRENVSLWEETSRKTGKKYYTGEVTEITAANYQQHPKEDVKPGV